MELCAGSAALTLNTACDSKPWVSYAGSKTGYASKILEIMDIDYDTIEKFTLVDPGPWGVTLNLLNDDTLRDDVANRIDECIYRDARKTWEFARKTLEHDVSRDEFVASHLLTIAGTYGGNETGGFKGKHKSRPNVDGFIPSRQNLADRVRKIRMRRGELSVLQNYAQDIVPRPCYCYIDPPYHKCSTKYRNSFERRDVEKVARTWSDVGARVIISENEPIKQLVDIGWQSIDITNLRQGQNRSNTRSKSEYLTCNFVIESDSSDDI